MSCREVSFWWLSGKRKWRTEGIDRRTGAGLIGRQDSNVGRAERIVYLQRDPRRRQRVLAGLRRHCFRASALETGTLSGVRVTVRK